jgi:hypothetical protein
MKTRRMMVRLLTVFLGTTSLLWSAEHTRQVKSGQWTGWIVDSTCQGKNANVEGKGCVLSCVKNGATLLLSTEPGRPLFGLDDQKLASQHVGYRVRVSGDQDGAYIKIKKIEPAEAAPRPQGR